MPVQGPPTKQWDTYGTDTAIDPQRQYHVKIKMGTLWLEIKVHLMQISIFNPILPELPKTAENGLENRP